MPGGYSVVGSVGGGDAPSPVDPGPVWKVGRSTRIMPIGDSITRGQGGEAIGGWRGPLWETLRAAGRDVTPVGSLGDVAPRGYWAVGGWRISDSAGWGERNFWARNGVDDVRLHRPDTLLVHLGTNDTADGDSSAQIADWLFGYRRYLDSLYAVHPGAHVFVARIVRQENQWAGTTTWNDAVEEMVRGYIAAGRPYHVVTGMEGMPAGSWSDGLHPNEAGYRYMAQVWADALQGVG